MDERTERTERARQRAAEGAVTASAAEWAGVDEAVTYLGRTFEGWERGDLTREVVVKRLVRQLVDLVLQRNAERERAAQYRRDLETIGALLPASLGGTEVRRG